MSEEKLEYCPERILQHEIDIIYNELNEDQRILDRFSFLMEEDMKMKSAKLKEFKEALSKLRS